MFSCSFVLTLIQATTALAFEWKEMPVQRLTKQRNKKRKKKQNKKKNVEDRME